MTSKMKLEIQNYDPKLPMDLIDIADTNARITRQTVGLDDLKDSIKTHGLFQPVTVFEKDGRFKLLVGQRRFLACTELNWDNIPAFIVRPLSIKAQTIVSFGENVHRKQLPYEDSIQVCDKLYDEYTGSKKLRVENIANDLGISKYLVKKYLAHKLIPPEVRTYISKGKLSEDIAYRITSAHFPNVKKIIDIATQACRMTTEECKRVVDYGKNNPDASSKEIINYAISPPPIIELVIHIEPTTNDRLVKTSKRNKTSIETYVKDAIERQLDEDE